jgi:hypothetical protein
MKRLLTFGVLALAFSLRADEAAPLSAEEALLVKTDAAALVEKGNPGARFVKTVLGGPSGVMWEFLDTDPKSQLPLVILTKEGIKPEEYMWYLGEARYVQSEILGQVRDWELTHGKAMFSKQATQEGSGD